MKVYQRQFPNIDSWKEHLRVNASDSDHVEVNLDAEHQQEDCHYRGSEGGKFNVQAEWDDWFNVNAEDIISHETV